MKLRYTVGDTAPPLRVRLLADARIREPFPVLGSVTFRLRRPDGTTVNIPGSVVGDSADGIVEATFAPTDLNENGHFFVSVRVTGPGSSVQTFHGIEFLVED